MSITFPFTNLIVWLLEDLLLKLTFREAHKFKMNMHFFRLSKEIAIHFSTGTPFSLHLYRDEQDQKRSCRQIFQGWSVCHYTMVELSVTSCVLACSAPQHHWYRDFLPATFFTVKQKDFFSKTRFLPCHIGTESLPDLQVCRKDDITYYDDFSFLFCMRRKYWRY